MVFSPVQFYSGPIWVSFFVWLMEAMSKYFEWKSMAFDFQKRFQTILKPSDLYSFFMPFGLYSFFIRGLLSCIPFSNCHAYYLGQKHISRCVCHLNEHTKNGILMSIRVFGFHYAESMMTIMTLKSIYLYSHYSRLYQPEYMQPQSQKTIKV